MKFPKNFLWGAATSASQTESFNNAKFKSQSSWDYWFENNPEKFYNKIGPDNTNDTYVLFEEDIECMKNLNINSFRTSISWSRLLPDGKNINKKAVKFYKLYFQKIRKNNIKVFVCLFHFDLPMWIIEKGGWTNHKIIEWFGYYANVAFDLFGDLVDFWITYNEPMIFIECSYLNECHYPAVVSLDKAIISAWHALLAHKNAISVFRNKKLDSQIGIVLILGPVYSASNHYEDLIAQKNYWLIHVDFFLRACVKNEINLELIQLLKNNKLLNFSIDQKDWLLLKNYEVDFIGVNYYQPFRVQKYQKEINPEWNRFYSIYNWKEGIYNLSRGWEIYPEGIYDIAMDLKNNYPNLKWYLSETGYGMFDEERYLDCINTINDDYRIEFYLNNLKILHKSIKNGAKCFGFHAWTLIDCWSWLNAYRNRYGFYYLDLISKKRSIKKSGKWYRDFINEQK